MKRLAIMVMIAAMLNAGGVPGCTHVHDEECGYDPVTGEGCTHECDDECGGIVTYGGGCAFCQD